MKLGQRVQLPAVQHENVKLFQDEASWGVSQAIQLDRLISTLFPLRLISSRTKDNFVILLLVQFEKW